MSEEITEALSMVEAATLAGVAERTIRRAVKAKKLAADLSNPKKARIRIADLERWKGSIASAPHDTNAQLLRRIEALEGRVAQLERHLDTQRKRVKSVSLVEFANAHNVATTEYWRAINMEVLPVQKKGNVLMLDGPGQHAFWRAFHELLSYTPCADCPH